MLELKGLKYSRESFDNYKHRMMCIVEKNTEEITLTVYTTDTSKENTIKVVKDNLKTDVSYIKTIHWCTKEQDDKNAELIDEWLSEA